MLTAGLSGPSALPCHSVIHGAPVRHGRQARSKE